MSKFQELINGNKPVLIDFFATWCGPCQALAPILIESKEELGDAVNIIKIDVDKNQEIAAHFQVKGVPTMMLFQNGKMLWRQSGVVSKNEIVSIVKQKIYDIK
ncbi:thioredoxin [Flavobacterium sp.]|jgi:thioredoxin 1|uniref:thioredoxin n=1 Tax=Flavobacterium sp. TaxID=239 RepID=UPI0037BE5954